MICIHLQVKDEEDRSNILPSAAFYEAPRGNAPSNHFLDRKCSYSIYSIAKKKMNSFFRTCR